MSRSATAALAIASLALAGAGLGSTQRASAAGSVAHPDISYDLDSPPAIAAENQLDVYQPQGFTGRRPVVVFVHGGGWRRGDKGNGITDKARLFTDSGYVFVSINYRLSPDPPSSSDPGRVMFPDHPHDVGEAIGWLKRHADEYGGDRDRIVLLGHSAGAHLVSLVATDPSYVEAYEVPRRSVIGAVPLDTAAFDVTARAAPSASPLGPEALDLMWNAFGTPQENERTGSWDAASPIAHANPGDPPFLVVTQAASPIRQQESRRMAAALGQDPSRDVLPVGLDHAGINDALGSPGDASGETEAVMEFVDAAAYPPRARIKGRPDRKVRAKHRRARVRFAFKASVPGSSFECRLDARDYRECDSPQSYRMRPGRHRFKVRAANDVAAGSPDSHRFRVLRDGR